MENLQMGDKYSNEEMLEITSKVVNYLDLWGLKGEEVMAILGVPEVRSRHLPKYRALEKALPQTEEVLTRVDHIVGIADALRTTYPFNKQMRVRWLHQGHHRFRKRTPLSLIIKEGINGLVRVRIELDCSYGWAVSDAMYAAQVKASKG